MAPLLLVGDEPLSRLYATRPRRMGEMPTASRGFSGQLRAVRARIASTERDVLMAVKMERLEQQPKNQ